jgi:predicted ATPase
VLTSVRLQNYRCFKDAEVRLGPLTVLVGPNASGKTTLLRAIATRGVHADKDVWQRTENLQASLTWSMPAGSAEVRFKLGRGTTQDGPLERIPPGQYLHLDADKMRMSLQVQEQTVLSEDGSNLTNVVATLGRRQQEQLARDLSRLVPVIRDVTPRPGSPGKHRLVFQDRWKSDVWYEPHDVSDGTILTLGLLTLQYQSSPVSVVAIEEPEHGLHPYLLGEMVETFRKLAKTESGRAPLQIVLATQSAELLEFLSPDEVRFLTRRSEDGSVVIEEAPTGSEAWREAYQAHQESLGSLWLSGGIGGVPTG